jgi:hypothetical protein
VAASVTIEEPAATGAEGCLRDPPRRRPPSIPPGGGPPVQAVSDGDSWCQSSNNDRTTIDQQWSWALQQSPGTTFSLLPNPERGSPSQENAGPLVEQRVEAVRNARRMMPAASMRRGGTPRTGEHRREVLGRLRKGTPTPSTVGPIRGACSLMPTASAGTPRTANTGGMTSVPSVASAR